MIRLLRHQSQRVVFRVHSLALIALVAAWMFASGSDGRVAAQSLTGPNVRVSTHYFFPADPFFSATGAPDVLQQNEPSIAVHPQTPALIAVGMNDVRTLAISDDAWQGLAVSTD